MTLGFLSVLVFIVTASGWAFYTYVNGNTDRVSLSLGSDRPEQTDGATNYLVVGTDSRANSGGAYGDVEGQRSDTTILVHFSEDETVTMLSFPRDTYVQIPKYTDSAGKVHAAHKNKFNSAISDGGPSLLVRTVESLTNLRIDHYVSMDLEGFKAITDAIGGVDVCVLPSTFKEYVSENGRTSRNTNDPMSGFVGGPGTVHVNGEQALAFVRQRHGLPGGDLDRIHRQQQFMGAVFHKVIGGGVLKSPSKLEGLISTATGALTLDDNTDIMDLRKLATRLKGIASGGIAMQTLPTHAPGPTEGGNERGEILIGGQRVSVQLYNPADLEKIIAPLGGSTGVATTGTGSAAMTVQVFNGTTIAGLAAGAVDELTAKGYQATNSGNTTDSSNYVTSRVRYGAGMQDAATALQALVPGARLESDASITGLQLILGTSFDGLTDAPVTASSVAAQSTAAHAGSATATGSGTQAPAAAGAGADVATTAPEAAAPTAPNCTY
ncbi:LCP family protein [Parafrankia sp. EUN1f]|uniref:LCP family protein n=1 Tax=Parafrankia sp. EUN1f TaxID=102897 RepID=UPI0001C474A9|nr:LCP family protein [Parafrankia sp. EUN1f]EFC79879.1 cell envelope-related transcriptional attenuator [Parafrankia sp. EUN1f]